MPPKSPKSKESEVTISTDGNVENLNMKAEKVVVEADLEVQGKITAEAQPAEVAADAEVMAKPKELPATIEIKTREGYTIVGRKPTWGDRRWMFIMPVEGMKLPGNEVMAAACIQSIVDPDGKDVALDQGIHPWFHLEAMGLEGPIVYVGMWNTTYMPANEDYAQGMLYAMQEMAKGNA